MRGVFLTPPMPCGLFRLRLKGCAKRFTGAACASGTHRDLGRGTTGVHIMIVTVLNVTLDPLDVLAAAAVFILLLFHVIILLSFLKKCPLTEPKVQHFHMVSISRSI